MIGEFTHWPPTSPTYIADYSENPSALSGFSGADYGQIKHFATQGAVVAGLSFAAAQAFAPNKKAVGKYMLGIASLATLLIFINNKPLPNFF